MDKYSVYMSVYIKENPEYFYKSVESMINQTIKPDEIIIVCDGPLTTELENVLSSFCAEYPFIKAIRLKENMGRSYAAQVGLNACSNEIVLRMDSDDISLPYRAELSLEALRHCDIVGGIIAEFDGDVDNITGLRILPNKHNDIVKFSKKRSPINNVTVAFKKSLIEKINGYNVNLKYAEDYFLWVKAIQNGAICNNINYIFVYVRAGNDMASRRNDEFYKATKTLRKYMLKTKYINFFQYGFYNLCQWFVFHMPNCFKLWFYKTFLRKSCNKINVSSFLYDERDATK